MKTTFKAIGKLLILGALSAAPLCAQMGNGLAFTTSFPFYVGNQQMPAGSYTVKDLNNTGSDMLLIADADHAHSAFMAYNPTETLDPANRSLASFNEYGDVAFLNSLTVAGDTSGVELAPSKLEKETASRQREQASNLSVPVEGVAAGN